MKPTKRSIQETQAIVRFYQFLRYKCGLKYADKFSTKDLKYCSAHSAKKLDKTW